MINSNLKFFLLILFSCVLLISNLQAKENPYFAPTYPVDFMNLPKQNKALIRDLKLLNYPPLPWTKDSNSATYDVVIIGAGMAGLTAGAALFREGIFNIQLFDQSAQGAEGPWVTYARMKTLRSPKELVGPALDIPHLTFHAWFEAQWGQEAWNNLYKIPNQLWMDYLNWYREAWQLPVKNDYQLVNVIPLAEYLELEFRHANQSVFVKTRKLVLATGRNGFGGAQVPAFMQHLPSSRYAHTLDFIDFEALRGCQVGVLGVGASAFDAAAVALEKGAKSVDLLMRRSQLPNVNKFASLFYKSFNHGYYKLDNEKRWDLMCAAFDTGIPPPLDALKRLQAHKNFHLRSQVAISEIKFDEGKLQVHTNQGIYHYDFLILGTGFKIDGYLQPEMHSLIGQIALWQDHMPAEKVACHPNLGNFPYLGLTFEFLPKVLGSAPFLKNIYCFNYGATLSHGLLSSDIPAISTGARRLAEGIAADFFVQDYDYYLDQLKNYSQEDFNAQFFN